MWTFIETCSFLQFRNSHFTYHMYAFLECITVETRVDRHSNVVQIYKICCAIVNIKNLQQPYFHFKLNLNNMVAIGLCLFKALLWTISVSQTMKYPHLICTVAHVMLCFTRFYQITEKLYSSTTDAHNKRIIDMLKRVNVQVLVTVLYGRIQMSVPSITYVIQNYTHCQYYCNPLIYLLTVGSVHQDITQMLQMD